MRKAGLWILAIVCISIVAYRDLCIAAPPATAPSDGLVRLLGNSGLRIGKPWAFTPDGTGLYTLRDNRIYLWDAATAKTRETFSEENPIFYAARSGDGDTVAACTGNQIGIWNVTLAEKIASVPVAEGWAFCPALSHDGKRMAWIMPNFKGITVREVASSREIAHFLPAAGDGDSFSLVFSPDGSLLAEAATGVKVANPPQPFSMLRVWDIAGKKLRFHSKNDEAGLPVPAFSPDGKRLAGGCHHLCLWNTATGKELSRIDPQNSACVRLTWTKAGRIVAATIDPGGASAVKWFDPSDDKLRTGASTSLASATVVLSEDGRIIAYGDVAAGLTDTATGMPFGDNSTPTLPVTLTGFADGGHKVVSVCEDGSVYLWETSSGKFLKRFNLTNAHTAGACLSADGSTLVTTDEARIYVHATETGKQLYTAAPKENGRISYTAATRDGKRVVATGRIFRNNVQWGVFAWRDAPAGDALFEQDVHTFNTNGISYSADARFVAIGCGEGNVRIFDGVTGMERTMLKQRGSSPQGNAPIDYTQSITAVDLSADGLMTAAINQRGELLVWETSTGLLVRQAPMNEPATKIRFDPRGLALATQGPSGAIHFWEVATGSKIGTLQCLRGTSAWSFSPDGQYVVTGGEPGASAIWKSPLNSAHTDDLVKQDLEKIWTALGDPDATHAYQAGRGAVAKGEPAIAFFAEKLTFAPPSLEMKSRTDALIRALSDDEFKTRRSAERQLRELGAAVHPLLIAALNRPPSIEARLTLERIVKESVPPATISSADARYLRVISIIEQIGGRKADEVLQHVYDTSTNPHAIAEAQAALLRLRSRAGAGGESGKRLVCDTGVPPVRAARNLRIFQSLNLSHLWQGRDGRVTVTLFVEAASSPLPDLRVHP